MIGKLTQYVGDRGFSFFRHAEGYGRTFVHLDEFRHIGIDMPSIDDTFEFDVVEGRRDGRPRAVNLKLIN